MEQEQAAFLSCILSGISRCFERRYEHQEANSELRRFERRFEQQETISEQRRFEWHFERRLASNSISSESSSEWRFEQQEDETT